MSLLKFEMKKMFFYQKGLVYIGLYFILSLVIMIATDQPTNPDMERNIEQYTFYVNQVKGPLTEEKKQFFSLESNQISDTHVALDKVYNDYYDGEISEDELNSLVIPLEEFVKNESGFKPIFDQYTYVRENPENRYFLYTNGWDGLLSNESLDLLFLLLLLLLVAPVFCLEYASEMDSLHLTVKKGTRVQPLAKVGLVFMAVIVLCILSSIVKYGFFSVKYGLSYGDYPLQSLSYFGTSNKDLTLFSTFVWLSVLKTFGYLSLSILIMLFSVWTKKYALTLFTSTAVILLPYYGLSMSSSKYFMPGPLGFIISTGYFKGSEYEYNVFTDQMDLIFKEISLTTLFIFLAITLLISLFALLVIIAKHTNVWGAGLTRFWSRKLGTTLILFITIASLTGCSLSNEEVGKNAIYNFSTRHSFENEKYQVYLDDSNLDDVKLVFEDKATGKTNNFIRNPMQSLTKVNDSIYGNGSFVYYVKVDYEKSGFRNLEEPERVFIVEVDTNTFAERVVFEQNVSTQKDDFLGIHSVDVVESSFYTGIDSFFLDDKNLYFVGEDEIRQINRLTGKSSVIVRYPVLRSVAFDGQNIYYINEKYQVVQYDTKTESEWIIPNVITTSFLLTDNELLYLNRKDKNKIYAYNLIDSLSKQITEKSVLSFKSDEQYIYYESMSDLRKYRMDRDGKNETPMSNDHN